MFPSRIIANRILVRAFTSTRRTTQALATTATNDINGRSNVVFTGQYRWKSTQPIEEDSDDALDSLLEDAVKGSSTSYSDDASNRTPEVLLEKVDPNDRKFQVTSNPRWTKAGLSQKVIDVLSRKGITHFTPVQVEAFDPVLGGRDVIGRSRTGTGKTLAFGIPSATRLVELAKSKGFRDAQGRMRKGRPVSMIVLCPTRELARQVQDELSSICRPLGLFTEVFHGGVSYDPQTRALRQGVDIVVGTPGRLIDHLNRGNLSLRECEIAVLDEADEMLNMGFAEDVETLLEELGEDSGHKSQVLLFSATTPKWVKTIGKQYQKDVHTIDSTGKEGGARVATTVRHTAVQVPPGFDAKKSILEDIIAVEISRDMKGVGEESDDEGDGEDYPINEIAAAALAKKASTAGAMQQKVFGKTIVFVETKREADELVSGSVFKSLTAQALHGDIGQKQRDATLAAFRSGAFNVLVATDVAARGIDISNVDLIVQFDPPRDVDTYVHRSGRTGRAGNKGVSVLLFGQQQQRDIVRIEKDLGHGFKFDLAGPPSIEAALHAAAKTSAVACTSISDETAEYFKESARALLEENDSEDIVARCLAAISRRSTDVQSRSLLTGELGLATVEMTKSSDRRVSPGDVMFLIGKLSRMSHTEGDVTFDSDVGKMQINPETGAAYFDMGVEDAKRLVEFSNNVDTEGARFSVLKEMEIERGRDFGRGFGDGRRGGRDGRRDGRRGGGGYNNRNSYQDRRGGRDNRRDSDRRGGNRGRSYDDNRRDFDRRGGNRSRSYDDNQRDFDRRGGNRSRSYDDNQRNDGRRGGNRGKSFW